MIKVIKSTKRRVQKAADGSDPFVCRNIVSRPIVSYFDITELLTKDSLFSNKFVFCVDCFVHLTDALAVLICTYMVLCL
jgi:hypothetical protein